MQKEGRPAADLQVTYGYTIEVPPLDRVWVQRLLL